MIEKPNLDLMSRRHFVVGGSAFLAMGLAGCTHTQSSKRPSAKLSQSEFSYLYGPRPKERFPVPAVKQTRFPEGMYRREVSYQTAEKPGTLVVDTKNYFLYLVGKNGRAMRYGVGLGRAGFEWSGSGQIAWKRKWPTWTPPREMIAREPKLAKFSESNGGMDPGLRNPLGSRALYIYQNGKDTLYRLHGTQDARSIGKAVSSGCVRLINQDIIDLYERVPANSKIVVI